MLIIAHRGYPNKFPENTLLSVQEAIKTGAHMIEVDVHLTKDGKLAVIHDDNLFTFTGKWERVEEMNMKEIQEKTSHFFKNRGFPDLTVPELKDVLETVYRYSENCGLVIEIKKGEKKYRGISDEVMGVLKFKKMLERTLISSFDLFTLEYLRSKYQDIKLSFLPLDESVEELKNIHASLRLHSLHLPVRNEGVERGKELKKHGIRVWYYVVNDKKSLIQAIHAGAEGIFTDDPPLMKNLLEEIR